MPRRFMPFAILVVSVFCFFAFQECAPAAQSQPASNSFHLEKVRELRGVHVNSPKSVIFSPDGSVFYVNSLEGGETLVYGADTLELKHVIRHRFGRDDAGLFLNGEDSVFGYAYMPRADSRCRNCFMGKPVESVLTHNGRYLWVSFYRRDYDQWAQSPSAMAVIDTATSQIVRVMPTGPLPKVLAVSADGRKLAVIHWGDNTVGLVDIASDDPAAFSYTEHLIAGKQLDTSRLAGKRRDAACGLCLRGAAFSPDGKHLFVARMSGGGIEVFDLEGKEAPRVVCREISVPRHLVLSRDGETLFVSARGTIYALPVNELKKAGGTVHGRSLHAGSGLRTIALNREGDRLYAVDNHASTLSCIDLKRWKILQTVPVPRYAVGLAVSPDGKTVVTTSQGKNGEGGHVVTVYAVHGDPQQAKDGAPQER